MVKNSNLKRWSPILLDNLSEGILVFSEPSSERIILTSWSNSFFLVIDLQIHFFTSLLTKLLLYLKCGFLHLSVKISEPDQVILLFSLQLGIFLFLLIIRDEASGIIELVLSLHISKSSDFLVGNLS